MANTQALRNAVQRVIEQNLSLNYRPNRFIHATEHGLAANIVEVCERLLTNPETLEHIEPAVRANPGLLTLEDEVLRDRDGFGLPESVRASCAERVRWFDQICPSRRRL